VSEMSIPVNKNFIITCRGKKYILNGHAALRKLSRSWTKRNAMSALSKAKLKALPWGSRWIDEVINSVDRGVVCYDSIENIKLNLFVTLYSYGPPKTDDYVELPYPNKYTFRPYDWYTNAIENVYSRSYEVVSCMTWFKVSDEVVVATVLE
jgi:hypothetical protein